MAEWHHAEQDPSDQLCQLHHFAVQKHQPEGDIEFVITIKEYVNPPYPTMKFLAQADKQTNQKKYMTEVVAQDLVLLGGRGEGGGGDDAGGRSRGAAAGGGFDQRAPEPEPAASTPISDEDIPF